MVRKRLRSLLVCFLLFLIIWLSTGASKAWISGSVPKARRMAHLQQESSPGTIFVSIAAFLDPELPETLKAMLMHAERPELLNVGIVWQGLEDPPLSETELSELHELWQVPLGEATHYENTALGMLLDQNRSFPHMPHGDAVKRVSLVGGHIRLLDIQAKDARGCHWARYIAQLLWEGEDFYLQLDSHMRFTKPLISLFSVQPSSSAVFVATECKALGHTNARAARALLQEIAEAGFEQLRAAVLSKHPGQLDSQPRSPLAESHLRRIFRRRWHPPTPLDPPPL